MSYSFTKKIVMKMKPNVLIFFKKITDLEREEERGESVVTWSTWQLGERKYLLGEWGL